MSLLHLSACMSLVSTAAIPQFVASSILNREVERVGGAPLKTGEGLRGSVLNAKGLHVVYGGVLVPPTQCSVHLFLCMLSMFGILSILSCFWSLRLKALSVQENPTALFTPRV